MVYIYTGLPRQGKTLHCVADVTRAMYYGRGVVSNTPIWTWIRGRKVFADFYDDPEEYKFYFLNAVGKIIVCDESSLYFSSLRWNNLGMDFFGKFRQAGKMGCDLYCTSQAWVDTVSSLRRIADVAIVCTKRHWLLPWPIDLRFDIYNKKRMCYERKGLYWATPRVYKKLTVSPGWFYSQAQLPENRERYIYGRRTMYPSEFRAVSRRYDHEYQITSSAVAKLQIFGKWKNYSEYQEALSLARKKVTKDEQAKNGKDTIPTPADKNASKGIT
jgi:hypothetical protein